MGGIRAALFWRSVKSSLQIQLWRGGCAKMVRVYILDTCILYTYTIIYVCKIWRFKKNSRTWLSWSLSLSIHFVSRQDSTSQFSILHVLQLSAWLLQRVACSWRRSNVLNQQNQTFQCANTIQYHPIPFWSIQIYRSGHPWIAARRSLRKPLRSAKNSEVPCRALYAISVCFWILKQQIWPDKCRVYFTQKVYSYYSCCIFMHVYMLANWTWFHVGIPDAIPFPALRI